MSEENNANEKLFSEDKENLDIQDDNSNNSINSNENKENDNLKRTLVSPEISPDDLNIMDEKEKEDDTNELNDLNSDNGNDNDNYNPNPFLSPNMKKKKIKTLSKMDRIINEYNEIKSTFNKILSNQKQNQKININKKEKYLKKLSEYNTSMLNQLSELSKILKKIVENQNIYANKKLLINSSDTGSSKGENKISAISNLESSEKMLKIYEKQYNNLIERLEKIKSKDYIINLKSNINKEAQNIAFIEQENRELHKNQIIQGYLLSNNSTGKTPESMENNLKKKSGDYDKLKLVFKKITNKIENDQEVTKENEEKLNVLNEKYNNLVKMAKDMYQIEKFENVEKIKKRSKEKKVKDERKAKEFAVNIHSINSRIKKLKMNYEQNIKDIEIIEEENNNLIQKYQRKQEELNLSNSKLKDYLNINFNFGNEYNNYNNYNNNQGQHNPIRRNLNIKLESFNNKGYPINRTEKKYENKKFRINSIKNLTNDNNSNGSLETFPLKDKNLNKIAKILSSGPSKISVDKERSNFGDINDDMQLLNSSNNQKNENDNNYNNNNNNNNNSKIEVKIESQISNSDNKQIKTEQNAQNNINKFKIDNDMNINIKDNILTENNINQNNINNINQNLINNDNGIEGGNNGKYFSPLKLYKDYNLDKNAKTLDKMKGNALSKEMILKGLDEQDKENKTLIYSSRNNKYNFDRKKFLKLNFSFISNKKDDILNRSLHTLPNDHNFLNDEIEENIIIDNSVDNINIKEIKVKKIETEENERINRPIKLEKNLNINNNNSIEINQLKLNDINNNENVNDNESKNKKENNDNNIEEDICEIISNNNENKSKNENVNKRRENALNTVLYNVGENNQVGGDIKNDKISQNKNNVTNNNSENVNKSFEEEHVFDKNNEKGNENDKNIDKNKEKNDNINDNFDDGDDIIDIDYEKI